ncbi:MAG: hypothetical protein HOL66_12240 [Rhodospirillaceae bacterium]|jgi:hypothetical protein|nr:hypothetical protein [Rhodospirillaceae bacterium]MBT5245001.1 hypothetical protein [Rhodospirillaceae bacterium]MBT5561113.1 hypothetical protein [Rhodospirillaceae bacterium]MBT6241002.1 hypothetical protein [Rhodospirillaceae bacterium]
MDIKKVVIIFSVFLMLSGGTVSVLKFLQIGPFEQVSEEDLKAEEEAIPDVPPVVIAMDDLYISILAEDRVAATVMIKLNLEVIGKENEEKVTKLLPRLGDSFFKDLYVFIPRVIRRQNKLNTDILTERLMMIGEKVMGPNVINNVIIEEVNER